MSTTESNPFLAGNLAPVHEEVTVTDLTVTGSIPDDLVGRYLRNGPNPVRVVNPAKYHWFSGTGMVHGIKLDGGRAEWYRNRWVRTREVSDTLGEARVPSDWPDDHPNFPANTNVVGHAGRTWAIVEAGSPPVELSYDLDTVRVTNLDGTLPMAFSAHPKRDPRTGELHVMTYWWGWGNQVQYLVVDTNGKVRRSVDIPLPGGPMIHDVSITEKYILVFDLPCVFNIEAAMSGASLPYYWDHSYEARIGLLPREGDATDIVWCPIDPCYIFHPLNSYDDGDNVILDAARHPKMFDQEKRGPSEGSPTLDRWVLNSKTGATSHQQIDGHSQEFPRIDERLVGLAHRYGYLAGIGKRFEQDTLIKMDYKTGEWICRNDSARFGYGEPVFIPRHDDADEDDGWVMALRYDNERNASDLAIFHAQDLTGDAVAVVHLPVRVPNGFHGNWIAD